MRYITQLQTDNAAMQAEITRLNDGLSALRAYMTSSKFIGPNPDDKLVNSEDVIRWIDQLNSSRVWYE